MILLPLSLILSVLGGASGAGWAKKTVFNANEEQTLMLNYIANLFSGISSMVRMMIRRRRLSAAKSIAGCLSSALFSAQMRIQCIVVGNHCYSYDVFFQRMKSQRRLILIGQGDKIATHAGVNVKKTVMVAMLISVHLRSG